MSFCWKTSFTDLSLYSSTAVRMMVSLPSSWMSAFASFRSKRVWTSFSAFWIALEISCRSTLLTMSNELSAIETNSVRQEHTYHRGTETQRNRSVISPDSSVPLRLCGGSLDSKKRAKIAGCGSANPFERHLAELRDEAGGLRDEGGLVALAAVRSGREVGRVGLN